jgi:hypothetical protein
MAGRHFQSRPYYENLADCRSLHAGEASIA